MVKWEKKQPKIRKNVSVILLLSPPSLKKGYFENLSDYYGLKESYL